MHISVAGFNLLRAVHLFLILYIMNNRFILWKVNRLLKTATIYNIIILYFYKLQLMSVNHHNHNKLFLKLYYIVLESEVWLWNQ